MANKTRHFAACGGFRLNGPRSSESRGDSRRDLVAMDYRRGQLMIKFLRSELGSLADKQVLDIGTGNGGITLAFADESRLTVGVDIDRQNCAVLQTASRLDHPLAHLHVLRAAGESLPFRSASFDLVIVNGVMEWVGKNARATSAEQQRFLDDVARVLSPQGTLYLAI